MVKKSIMIKRKFDNIEMGQKIPLDKTQTVTKLNLWLNQNCDKICVALIILSLNLYQNSDCDKSKI